MKKFLFSLVALLVVSASNMSINAQVFNTFASTISAEDLAGNYSGNLTKVYMK